MFFDVHSVITGAHLDTLTERVRQSRVLVAVMGPSWEGESDRGRRIDQPGDFVRLEIETALQAGVEVLPVRIRRPHVPSDALPASLARLGELAQGEMNLELWNEAMGRLIAAIEAHLGAD